MHAHQTTGLELWMVIYPVMALMVALVFRREVLAFLREKKGNHIFFVGAIIYLISVEPQLGKFTA